MLVRLQRTKPRSSQTKRTGINGVHFKIVVNFPQLKILLLKNSAEKQKMPKEKRAIGKRFSLGALFFGFVFSSLYVVFQPVFF